MDNEEYCKSIGTWVGDRLKRRCIKYGKPPEAVRQWVEWLKKVSGNPDYGEAPAPPAVMKYVTSSIEDPDWPSPQPGPPPPPPPP